MEILDNKFDYTDLAVSIALAELSSRKISEQGNQQRFIMFVHVSLTFYINSQFLSNEI